MLRDFMKHGKIFMLIALASVVLLGAGCSKLTKQNYDKIRPGMEYQQVLDILGDEAICIVATGAQNCTWGDAKKNITVRFAADKVVFTTSTGLNDR
jgi:hypothetical protein